LPIGTQLGDFKITNTIGFGGFGMVYLAYEKLLDRTVAIKEYLPVAIAGRASDQTVRVRSVDQVETYEAGLRGFVREAQLQARFSHPAMLEVYRVWEQNGTAYMAMRYYPGTSLRELRKSNAHKDGVTQELIRAYLEPVCDAVCELHAHNVVHRDISPDNILITANESPVLLDFGAARAVTLGGDQQLTTVLKPGYAPIEQYADDGSMVQGPWTDVYALGAVMYYLVVGSPPPQPVGRLMNATLKDFDAMTQSKYSANFVEAVQRALAVKPEERFQSVEDLCELLGWDAAPRTFLKSGVAVGKAKSAAGEPVATPKSGPTARASSRKAATRGRDRAKPSPPPASDNAPAIVTARLANDARTAAAGDTRKPIAVGGITQDAQPKKNPAPKDAAPTVEIAEVIAKPVTLPVAPHTAPHIAPSASPNPVARRVKAAYWAATPLVALAAFAIYRFAIAPVSTATPGPVDPPEKPVTAPQVADTKKQPNVSTPTPEKDSEATPKSDAPQQTQPTTEKAANPESTRVKPAENPSVEAANPAQARPPTKRDTVATATARSDDQRAQTPRPATAAKRAQPTTEDTTANPREAPRTNSDGAAECERLYAKLSLGTSELNASERERLAKCR
jgi:non-specific serine/threonine protein kinase